MGSNERKAILVVLDRLHRNIPALHRVALPAVGAELTPVDVSVTVRALCAHVAEHQLYVTLHALYLLVHSPKRVGCLVMVEFRDPADWFPARKGMTVFAGDRDGTVRIFGVLLRGSTALPQSQSLECEQEENYLERCSAGHVATGS